MAPSAAHAGDVLSSLGLSSPSTLHSGSTVSKMIVSVPPSPGPTSTSVRALNHSSCRRRRPGQVAPHAAVSRAAATQPVTHGCMRKSNDTEFVVRRRRLGSGSTAQRTDGDLASGVRCDKDHVVRREQGGDGGGVAGIHGGMRDVPDSRREGDHELAHRRRDHNVSERREQQLRAVNDCHLSKCCRQWS